MKLLNLYGVKTNTLAIIGNGFDIAHGYKTDYRSFVDNTKDEALDTFKEIFIVMLCEVGMDMKILMRND